MSAPVEIARFHHAQPLEECTAVLDAAGIPYRLSNDSFTQNLAVTQLGSSPSCIVTVAADQASAARLALLEAARKEVAAGVDPEHHLNEMDNEALFDVLRHPDDWSEYDLAVAEKLLHDRGVPEAKATVEPPLPPPLTGDQANEPLPGKRHASKLMLVFGFVLSGALIGIAVGLSYALSTESSRTPGRRQYVYDEPTRKLGMILTAYSIVVTFAWVWYVRYWMG